VVVPLVKKPLKRILKSLNLYPFLPPTLDEEAAFWKSTLFNWGEILSRHLEAWNAARRSASAGPKVLIACAWAGNSGNSLIDSLLAVALTLRGANVHLLLCDEALPACTLAGIRHYGENEGFVKNGPTTLTCKKCFHPGNEMFRPLGLPTHHFSELISSQELFNAKRLSREVALPDIPQFQLDGVPVGEQAMAGVLRFYVAGYIENEPHGEIVLRHYLNASLLTAYATRRLLKTELFNCVCQVHGIYVPHGVILDLARQQNVRSVIWSRTYRNQAFTFSHNDTYHRTMLSEPTEDWETIPWSPELEAEAMDYLKSRESGTRDWISYQKNSHDDVSEIATELGIDFSKPCIGMLTNVMGDGAILFPTNAFPNMLEWMFETLRYFARRPDLQLIIRVHPAEIRGADRSRQPIINEIKRVFSTLPPNVFLVPPENSISTYALMRQCDSVIIYATKTGVELTSLGIPVIVAGDSWIKNKGLTLDANSSEEYFELLDRLPLRERLSDAATQRARKYAYHFFFRRMIPLPFFEPVHPTYRLKISQLEDLLPGRSVGLDVVCNGILKGEKFIYPAELHSERIDDRMSAGSKSGKLT
jgi:Capsule polysaccharide biosynthesis protein